MAEKDEKGWTTKTTKKTTRHVTRTVISGGQQIKFREAHAFHTDVAVDQNFVLNDNLFHTEGIKRFRAKATKEGFELKTDIGDVNIKCPSAAAYFIYKDTSGDVGCRLMTENEIDVHSKKLPTEKSVVSSPKM